MPPKAKKAGAAKAAATSKSDAKGDTEGAPETSSGWVVPNAPDDTDVLALRSSMEKEQLQELLNKAADTSQQQTAESSNHAEGDDTGGLSDLGGGALGFEATPLASQPKPSQEELGNPEAAQRAAAERRRKEQALESRLLEAHAGGRVWVREGTGTIPYSHRLHHQPVDMFEETAEEYNPTPPVTDYPIQALNPWLQVPNTRVFLELSTATGAIIGKLVFELFERNVPRTAENFKTLCCGDPLKGEPSYVDCRFHRVIPGFMMVSGDIVNGDGTGGKSIYGDTFPDESFELMHVGPGILTMVNNGPDTNSSQFAILLARAEWLDGRNVVVGKLVSGYDLLHVVAARFGSINGVPKEELYIGACGINDSKNA